MARHHLGRLTSILSALLLLAGCTGGNVPTPAPVPPSTTLVFEGRVDLFDVTVLLGRWNREGKQPAADLTPFVLKSRFDTRSYAPVWDELYKDGRLLALPVKANPMFVVANDKLVREAGVNLPEGAWTWDQFREAVTA